MIQEIYQKQFSIGKILSESFKRFKENFQLILIINLIFTLPINIIYSYFQFQKSNGAIKDYLIIFNTLSKFIMMIPMIAITYTIKNKIDEKSSNIGEALKKSLTRLGAIIITYLIESLLLLGLALLLIIPAVITFIYWKFAEYAVILKDKSGISALDYSKNIVKGRWWTVLSYSIVFDIIKNFLTIIPFIILGIILFLPKSSLTYIIFIIFLTLIEIIDSFFIIVNTIFFINFDSTKKTYPTRFVSDSPPPSNYTKLNSI